MARPLRIEYAGAIYHVMSRGNARQKVFFDERDYGRFLEGLEATVDKFGFVFFSFVCMPNHVHLFFRTPRPNLSQGMQYLLSGYATWFNTRHRRAGHLFQGRFKGELIEDEQYFWTVSRYLHLNPVRGKRPLVSRPEEWKWSSYSGYRWKKRRVSWVAYEEVYRAWQGGRRGANLEVAYRRYVEAGGALPPKNPLDAAVGGWLLGSSKFVDGIKRRLQEPRHDDEVPLARSLKALSIRDVLDATAKHYCVDSASYAAKYNRSPSRDAAAWLARRLTVATLRELAEPFGLGHPDSVRNLIRRAERAMAESKTFRTEVESIKLKLQRE